MQLPARDAQLCGVLERGENDSITSRHAAERRGEGGSNAGRKIEGEGRHFHVINIHIWSGGIWMADRNSWSPFEIVVVTTLLDFSFWSHTASKNSQFQMKCKNVIMCDTLIQSWLNNRIYCCLICKDKLLILFFSYKK